MGARMLPVMVLAAAVSGIPAAESTLEPARAILSPQPRPPLSTAGTGIAPTAGVRLKVDARGKVTNVDVLSIRPSSRFDAEVKEEIVSVLSQWRFSPARRDREPVDATVQFELKFEPRQVDAGSEEVLEPASLGGHAERFWWRSSPGSTGEWWERRMRSLSPAERNEWTKIHVAAAEGAFHGERRSRAARGPFHVVTNSPSAQVAQVIAGNLAATWNALDALFGEAVPPLPDARPIQVFVYGSRAEFESLAAEFGLGGAGGFWIATGVLAFHLELPSSEHANAILMHEATHAYVSRRLQAPTAAIPIWLNEGLAEYVGHSEVRRGRILPGSHSRFRVYHAPGAVWRGKSEGELALADVKTAIAKGEAPGIGEWMAAPGKWYLGEKRALAYAQGWLFVHFLRHGRESWADREFPNLLLYASEGFPVAKAIEEVYGLGEADLDREWREYVRKF